MSNNNFHEIDPKEIFDSVNSPERIESIKNNVAHLLATLDSEVGRGIVKELGQAYIGVMSAAIMMAEIHAFKETGKKWTMVPEQRAEWLESIWLSYTTHNRSLATTKSMLDDIFKR